MIEKGVSEALKEIVSQNEKVVIGVSGGPDSMCLLDIMRNLRYNIFVAHINHLIRPDATDDENYVKKYCNKWNIPIFIKRIDINKMANAEKIGLEEAGRIARMEFYEEVFVKQNAQKIATAHNKNDVAETIIMNILRGSGINGMKAMEKIRDNKYIKPLIGIERKDIENYCKEKNLNPRIDSTNSDNTYTRNRIRNIVIPYLKEQFNPNIVQTLTRMSDVLNVEMEYMQNATIQIFNSICNKKEKGVIQIDLKEFNKQDLAIKRRLIRYAIEKVCGTNNGIEKVHIDDIIKLCSNNIGNKYLTPKKNIKIAIKNKQIYILQTNSRYDILLDVKA